MIVGGFENGSIVSYGFGARCELGSLQASLRQRRGTQGVQPMHTRVQALHDTDIPQSSSTKILMPEPNLSRCRLADCLPCSEHQALLGQCDHAGDACVGRVQAVLLRRALLRVRSYWEAARPRVRLQGTCNV